MLLLLLVSLFCGTVVCKNLVNSCMDYSLVQYLTALTEPKVLKRLNLTYLYQRNVKNIFYGCTYSFFFYLHFKFFLNYMK